MAQVQVYEVEEVAVGDPVIDDAELTEMALLADPDAGLSPDAVSWTDLSSSATRAILLPGWYMPTSTAGHGGIRGWRRGVGVLLLLAFLLIVISGLCSTYGYLEIA